jgi:hypothetical protein
VETDDDDDDEEDAPEEEGTDGWRSRAPQHDGAPFGKKHSIAARGRGVEDQIARGVGRS